MVKYQPRVTKCDLGPFSAISLGLEDRLLQSRAFPTELSWQVLIEGYWTLLLFVHQLTFWTYGAFTLPDTDTDTETNKKWVV